MIVDQIYNCLRPWTSQKLKNNLGGHLQKIRMSSSIAKHCHCNRLPSCICNNPIFKLNRQSPTTACWLCLLPRRHIHERSNEKTTYVPCDRHKANHSSLNVFVGINSLASKNVLQDHAIMELDPWHNFVLRWLSHANLFFTTIVWKVVFTLSWAVSRSFWLQGRRMLMEECFTTEKIPHHTQLVPS